MDVVLAAKSSITSEQLHVETEGEAEREMGERVGAVLSLMVTRRNTTYLAHNVLITCHKPSNSRRNLRDERLE